ncbi:MAG: hypothetical protein K2L50_01835 [Bacteroidales bacterium]|nr:hypothetical protein [Bacteroidales bacterium]
MNFVELYQRAMGPKGLSANFDGQTQKQEKEMTKMIENKAFGFVIKNDTADDISFALMPGALPNLSEIQKRYPHVKAILKDGEFFTDETKTKKVTCSCRNGSTVAFFHEYFKSIPGQATTLDMTSTEKENFYTEVETGMPNPCVSETLKRQALSDYLGTQQFDQNRVIAKGINIPLSAAHLVLLTIKAGSTVTYTFTVNTLY